MDGIQQVGADIKKHQAAGSPAIAGKAGKSESAANAFSALMETIGARFNGNFGRPSLESKLGRSEDAIPPREREAYDTESPREKDELRAAEKSESKPRDKSDEDTGEVTAKATNESTTSENNAGAGEGQTNTAQTDAQVTEVLAAEFPIIAAANAPIAAESVAQKVVTEAALPQQAALQATQAATVAEVVLPQQAALQATQAVKAVLPQQAALQATQAVTVAEAVLPQQAALQANQAVTVAKTVLPQQATLQATQAMTPQQPTLQVTQAVTEGASKELAATAVKTDGTAAKASQVATIAAATVKADTGGELGQFRQSTDTAAQTQQTAADTAAKTKNVPVKEHVTVKSQDAGQKGPLDLRSTAAQEQSQSLSKALGSDNKIQVQVATQGPQNVAATFGDQSPYKNIYSIQNQSNNSSLANGQVGAADATNALVQNSRSPAEQVQAQPAPASPVPAPQPQLQTSQQGNSSSQLAARGEGATPAPSQSGQASSGQSQSNAGFNLNAGQNSQASTETARAAQTTATDRPHTTPQQIIDQIKVNITRASKAGMGRITIQLKPEHLGRVEVKLEMSEDQKVRVTVTADSKDTLQILQTDSRGLERALNEAGLRTDANNLHFNLRGDAESQKANDGKNGDKSANDNDDAKDDGTDPEYDYAQAAHSRGGVDTFA